MSDKEQNKIKMREYMRKYIKDSPGVSCKICGGHYKEYKKSYHLKTKKHTTAALQKFPLKTRVIELEKKLSELLQK
jgi:hypothetical protein